MNKLLRHPLAWPVALLLCLAPLAWLVWRAVMNQLGANPAEALLRSTGVWTLRFLWVTLAVTPLRLWLQWPALLRFRRLLGVTTFGYALLHFLAYAWLDMGFDLDAIVRDIPKRPFALVGFAALMLLVPLAATSFNRAIRWLGAPRWQRLHKLVYVIAPLGLLHFFWIRASKHRWPEVALYAALLVLIWSARWWLKRRGPPARGGAAGLAKVRPQSGQ
ncbi:MAG: protein-methionine-sulfoxide reductase heme-binding subunit MsrQ [Burkholderiales bacterium]